MSTIKIVQPAQAAAPSRLRSSIARRPLAAFFALAFAFSWLITLPLLLGGNGLGLLPYTVPPGIALLMIIVQSFGPTVSGLVMASLAGDGARSLAKSFLRWKVAGRWYLVALVAPPLTILFGATVVRGASAWQSLAPAGWLDLLLLVPTYLINLAVLFFIGGPLGEEGGWRGFALPRLQDQHGPLVATAILGVLWVAWHLPNFFIPEMGTFQGNLLVFLAAAFGMAIIHTWVFNRANNSLLLVTLLHAAIDASTRTLLPIMFGTDRASGNLVPLIGFGVWALLVVALTGARLGYRPEEHHEGERLDHQFSK